MRADSAIFSAMSQAIQMYRTSGALQGERLLQICIGGSIVLHALALLYAGKIEPPVMVPAKITATLRAAPAPQPAAPEPVAAAPERAPAKPDAASPRQPATPIQPAPTAKLAVEHATPVSVAAVSVPVPATAAAAAPATPTPATTPVEAKSAAPASDAPKSAAATSAAPSNDLSDTDLINIYQVQLSKVVEKYRRYPSDAVQNNWVGEALVSMRIGSDGKLMSSPEITTSSGYEILDSEARTALNKAKSFVPIPAGLKGKEFVARMRIEFRLTKN